jgi:hypothetical protein
MNVEQRNISLPPLDPTQVTSLMPRAINCGKKRDK